MAFVYALIVPLWADQLLPQLLMRMRLPPWGLSLLNASVGFCPRGLLSYWAFVQWAFVLVGYCPTHGAFMGRATPTTAFDGAISYFAYTMMTH